MSITLILGGARSGKSALAQRLAEMSGRDVIIVATMERRDDEVRAKIAAHRAERPAEWRTIEEPLDLPAAIATDTARDSFVIVDCLTLWVSNLLLVQLGEADDPPLTAKAEAVATVVSRTNDLLEWCSQHEGHVTLVSNEVGLGLVPVYPLGRVFRDALGATNMLAAARADRLLQCSAGLVLDLKQQGAVPISTFGERAHPW